MTNLDILLLATPNSNIGNGFISKGAKSILTQSLPDANIHEVSTYPDYIAHRLFTRQQSLYPENQGSENNPLREQLLNISELVDPDLVVLPGCVLGRHGLGKFMQTLLRITDDTTPLLLLGVGGGDYSKSTQGYVKEMLEKLPVEGFIARDSTAYNLYADIPRFAYDGIDCAFFIDDWYTPPDADKEFVISTFDKIEEPDLDSTHQIIRPNHSPISPFQQTGIETLTNKLRPTDESDHLDTANNFFSDSIEDYLFLYANCLEVHSDRIHACVPALAYNNPAKFYFETPRALLFDKFFPDGFPDKPTPVDGDLLAQMKESQINATRKALDMCIET